MNDRQMSAAQACLRAAEENTLTFPEIVGRLVEEGFESYVVDFRRATATYYLPDGDSFSLAMHRTEVPVSARFDTGVIQAAIKEAQMQIPGYSYKGFCRKVASAGCAGYVVSFSGRRALYIGRTAETHIEHFPKPGH